MREVITKVYHFEELSKEAKRNAIDKLRDRVASETINGLSYDYQTTLSEFEELLGITIGSKDHYGSIFFVPQWYGKYGEYQYPYKQYDKETATLEDVELSEISGVMLQRWIRDNILPTLVRAKTYYSKDYSKERKSKVLENLEWSSIDTESLMKPFEKYMKSPDSKTTLEDIVTLSLHLFAEEWNDSCDSCYSDQCVKDFIEGYGEFEFTEDGTPFN
jgi:hypothetical protein